MARRFAALALAAGSVLATDPSGAFPPYRTTDAGTADPFLLEAHAGLIEVERSDPATTIASPLAQLSFGLPALLEISTDFAYLPDDGELGDASTALKWVPLELGELSFGVELGVGFPPTSADPFSLSGALLGTYSGDVVRLHVNAGAFSDLDEPETRERGLSAGLLAELDLGDARPGLELTAERVEGEPIAALCGVGSIISLGAIELRLGVFSGLGESAPDLVTSSWLTTYWPFAESE